MKIAVVALGKIGLPLAVQFAGRGHEVIGADVNPTQVDLIGRGEAPFPGEADLARRLADVVDRGLLTATTDTAAAVAGATAVVVVVPLVVDAAGNPDFAAMDTATHEIGRGLRRGTLVSYETTVPVGTTRGRWKPLLESVSGLTAGRDFDVVFSPERVLTGRVFADLRKYPKLVGALSPGGLSRGVAFYESVLEFDERPDLGRGNGVWPMASAEAAELAKLAETTYRDVNIALANQFAMFAMQHGVDFYEVIEASNSQPYSHLHRPGIAVGGHCIPVYPRLYLANDPAATVVSAARAANGAMPGYTVELASKAYGDLGGASVVVLGASYRGDVKETAFSGVFPTVAALESHGAVVTVHDPLFEEEELRELGLVPHELGTPVHVAVLQADHGAYRDLTPEDLPGVEVIVDGRNHLDASRFPSARTVTIGKAAPGRGDA